MKIHIKYYIVISFILYGCATSIKTGKTSHVSFTGKINEIKPQTGIVKDTVPIQNARVVFDTISSFSPVYQGIATTNTDSFGKYKIDYNVAIKDSYTFGLKIYKEYFVLIQKDSLLKKNDLRKNNIIIFDALMKDERTNSDNDMITMESIIECGRIKRRSQLIIDITTKKNITEDTILLAKGLKSFDSRDIKPEIYCYPHDTATTESTGGWSDVLKCISNNKHIAIPNNSNMSFNRPNVSKDKIFIMFIYE